uniref:Uncharacterized protein n=1 Tax=Panagrolaimus davidi TaxID=227884 RepID=A0A914PU90_9BILA
MLTRNDKYSFIEQSCTTSENRFYNLSLNQSQKCATLISVQSNKIKPNNDEYHGTAVTDFIAPDNYEGKGKLQSWNKSSEISTFKTFNEDNSDLKKRWKNENILNTSNKSTLFLHIEAYKNSTEAVVSDLFHDENIEGLKKEKLGSIEDRCFAEYLKSPNPFEFPRQQDADQRKKPEVMQFKTSQKLLGSSRKKIHNKSVG